MRGKKNKIKLIKHKKSKPKILFTHYAIIGCPP